MPNPGYGHPMRPEYLLTAEGQRLAPSSGRLISTVRRLKIEPLAFRKWTMPVTLALGDDDRRFSEIRASLPGITARALRSRSRTCSPRRSCVGRCTTSTRR